MDNEHEPPFDDTASIEVPDEPEPDQVFHDPEFPEESHK